MGKLFMDKSILKKKEALFIGGNFWDGRATGQTLGSPAAEQAQGPFLNPAEQALKSPSDVIYGICTSTYNALFTKVCGSGACDSTNVSEAYDCVGLSIAAYEASPEVNAFTSKFDYSRKGQAKLTRLEQQGWALFKGKGKCAKCHIATGQQTLFTDYTFDNLGIPKNPENPATIANATWADPGLGGFLTSRLDYAVYADANMGKHKVPTLRNVAKGSCEAEPSNPNCIIKAYGHNGYFKSLAGIVNFYNTRDVKPKCSGDYTESDALAANCWPAPEVAENVNTAELGNLGLTPDEEAAIVAFLTTLSDGYKP
jgi:cytochrome c peroxidase